MVSGPTRLAASPVTPATLGSPIVGDRHRLNNRSSVTPLATQSPTVGDRRRSPPTQFHKIQHVGSQASALQADQRG